MFVKPIKSFDREFATASDKSITHRAVMLNAAASGCAVIKNALLGGDCISTIKCMTALGAEIRVDGSTVYITGTPKFSDAILDAGNSGTTARLLAGLLSGKNCNVTISGDESLSKRPMRRISEPLRQMGAKIETTGGTLPMNISPARLCGIDYQSKQASAQVKSAVLLAGLSADGETSVTEPEKSRDHTEIMLAGMGADIKVNGLTVTVKRGELKATDIYVPGDISSAAYLLGLAAVVKGASVTVKNTGLNRTRTGLLGVLKRMGADLTITEKGGVEPYGDVMLKNAPLKPFCITKETVPSLIDELPLLAAIACYAEGVSVISGAEELKVKESNRIDTTVAALRSMGADIMPTDDGMIINGNGRLSGGGTADSALDHRIAMSAAVAAAGSEKGGGIKDTECVYISYPGFFDILGDLS